MLTRKPCKYCDSMWHSKAKCPTRANEPLKAVYMLKGKTPRLSTENPSERPRLAYKGNSERSQLIGYADKFFSLYIRTRGSDGFDNHCYTCGVKQSIVQLQCGHFINRRYLNTRWHKLNCWAQCSDCNVEKHGNLEVYERKLRRQFGDDAIDSMLLLAQSNNKLSHEDIKEIINEHKGVVF